MSNKNRKFTWKRDPNYEKAGTLRKFVRCNKLPPTTPDVSANYNIPCYDQGTLGSCTAHGYTYEMEYIQHKQGVPNPCTTSRLAFYQCELTKDGNFGQDVGSTLTTGQWVCQNQGAAPESLWPYDVNNFAVQPPANYLAAASNQKGLLFSRVTKSIAGLKTALCEGFPVVCGFDVYPEFMTDEAAETGCIPNPTPGEKSVGGHCVVLVQMDDTTQTALFRNSWGTGWGKCNTAGARGYFTVSYAYLLSVHFSDFWICESLSETSVPATTAPVVPATTTLVVPATTTPVVPATAPVVHNTSTSTTPISPNPNLPIIGHYVPFPDPVTGPNWILVYKQTQ